MAALKIEKHTETNIDILSIGCINDTYLNLLSKMLSHYRQIMPQVHPLLRVIPSRSILNLFFNGEMDVLFGFKDDVPHRDGICYETLADIPICCAIPADHPFACKDSVTEQELLAEHIIICNSYEIPSEVAVIQHEIGRQVSPESINYCANALVSLTLVKAGYGVSILPRNISSDFQITYIPISDISPMSYGIFYKTASKNHLIRSFLEAAKECVPCLMPDVYI